MRNAGRYPDRDTSVSHQQLAQDRLVEVSMTTEQIQQIIDGRIGNYMTPAQVDAEAAMKLPKSELATSASNYVSTSDVTGTSSSNYVSLSSGKIPASQVPATDKSYYLEGAGPEVRRTALSTNAATGINKVACGSFTTGTFHHDWIPIFFGSIEVNISSGSAPVAITIDDSSGRTVALGQSTMRTGMNRVNICPLNLANAYRGTWTFTYYLQFNSGSGVVRSTQWQDSLTIFIAPWP